MSGAVKSSHTYFQEFKPDSRPSNSSPPPRTYLRKKIRSVRMENRAETYSTDQLETHPTEEKKGNSPDERSLVNTDTRPQEQLLQATRSPEEQLQATRPPDETKKPGEQVLQKTEKTDQPEPRRKKSAHEKEVLISNNTNIPSQSPVFEIPSNSPSPRITRRESDEVLVVQERKRKKKEIVVNSDDEVEVVAVKKISRTRFFVAENVVEQPVADPEPPTEETVERLYNRLQCPICFRNFKRNAGSGLEVNSDEYTSDVKVTKCGHVFCGDCIKKFVRQKKICAICKKPLNQGNIHPLYL